MMIGRRFIPLEIIPRRSAARVPAQNNSRGDRNISRKFLTGFISRLLLMAVPLAALFYFVWYDLAVEGVRYAKMNLRGYDVNVSPLYPLGRVSEPLTADGELWRQIKEEPVYFDVRVPRRLEEARLTIVYQERNIQDLRVGLKVGNPGDWLYALKPMNALSAPEEDSWLVGEAVFDLNDAAIQDQRLRFMISAPGLPRENSELRLKNIEVKLAGSPLKLTDIIKKVWLKLVTYTAYAG